MLSHRSNQQHTTNSTEETMPTATLYEKIGGEKAIDAAVDLFYRKVLADDRISHLQPNSAK